MSLVEDRLTVYRNPLTKKEANGGEALTCKTRYQFLVTLALSEMSMRELESITGVFFLLPPNRIHLDQKVSPSFFLLSISLSSPLKRKGPSHLPR